MTTAELRERARLHGIQLSYEDAAGEKRIASRESLEAALRAFPPRPRERAIEPVTVVWGSAKVRVPFPGAGYKLTLESGEKLEGRLTSSGVLDRALPFGYHRLRLGRSETMVFVAPRRAPEPQRKTWGVFAPLYALHTSRTWGIGDLGDMRALQQWVRGCGGDFIGTLPMNAIFAERDPSPYAPISRLFWNEMYIDVRALPEYRGEVLEPLPLERDVDYPRVMRAKRALLAQLAHRFFENPDEGFGEYASRANDYALFRSRMESTAGLWREWADEDEYSFEAARYHLYVQYRMQQQLHGLDGLYLDFPLGVHANGYDAWRYEDHFATGVSAGAPPDLFFTRGQNWGFPPLHPRQTRLLHHAYFRECVRCQLEHASMLRIDHVMGLHRLFWIPEGMEPKDGVYVHYPEDELYAILMIEAHRANAVIIGEDLGTVPKSVPRMMEKRGVHRMFVVQYEAKASTPPRHAIASINTHDMPPFAGFWDGRDIEDRERQGLLDARGAAGEREKRKAIRRDLEDALKARGLLSSSVLEGLLRFLSRSDAEIVLVNLEDLWAEEEPQNRPGVPDRSWRHRMRLSLEEMQQDETVMRALRAVDHERRTNYGNES